VDNKSEERHQMISTLLTSGFDTYAPNATLTRAKVRDVLRRTVKWCTS
jgi:hypothetical protein